MRPAAAPGILKGALFAVSCLVLSGCISLGEKAPEQLFRLTPEETAPTGATASGKLSDAIVVMDPETDRSLDVLRIPVRVDASQLAYLQNAAWIEKPAREFRSLLAETVRTETGRLVVEGGDFEVTGETFLRGRLLEMGYDVPRGAVVVRFDAIRSGAPGSEVVTKRFEAVVTGVEPKAKYVGPALNQAANDVARQVADWIKGG
ncbi:ABC-type transport auxiliary lipoprotein family protein [Novosphingobium album (ex Hu et al. 2023)]|uniref:ABC-type transport auxiliary lipoprotein family protein n=1 Tax=Novosphingobium album (ex Hu et al. 2023) TaxID=2930093 RepID=A0ABT0AXB3_9SPHN|nr:ABC-type transport auxiliary lipoprotein family protein [Novosphingobium album (ex Hu et al. 2023)]MCJ2177258.1 ABC-type transport auxiliary lipoprotein family protein [Novosphingobium album (ex Hu et al. 2023)]